MKAKTLVLADTHFGIKRFDKKIFEKQLDYFKEVVFPYIKSNNIYQVVIAGDLVDNKQSIDIYLLDKLNREFFSWFEDNGILLFLILGNHDFYYKKKKDFHFLTSLQHFENIKVIDKPTELSDDVLMVPWNTKIMAYFDDYKTIIGHFELDGFIKGFHPADQNFDGKP